MLSILSLPENILLSILQRCTAQDLGNLSVTCSLLNRLVKDALLWRSLCYRDFNVTLGSCDVSSYEDIYKNLLHKYGRMLGLYQTQIGPNGGLLEIRFKAGFIEGVAWQPTSNVMEPLQESIEFSINGNEVPAECLCLPDKCPHKCFFDIDKRKGIITQRCSNQNKHMAAVIDTDTEIDIFDPEVFETMKHVYLNEAITNGLIHKPLVLPEPNDIPIALRRNDGSFPQQIITPGLFKGTYSTHGIELILFRYKDENEIHGHKITGDDNVPASKVSVKVNLKYPVDPSVNNNSIEALKSIEPVISSTPLDQIPKQRFSIPHGCHCDDITVQIPSSCIARYHGFGQIAGFGFQSPRYSPTHVVIFSNDLLGVIFIELQDISLYSRVKNNFTTNVNTGKSCV